MSLREHGHVLFVCERPVSDPVVETVSRELGQVLVRATSAADGLALAQSTDFALILMGYTGNDAEIIATIHALCATARARHTPIVVLGVPPGPGFALEPLYEAGAIAVIAEPVSPAILKAKARFYLNAFETAHERLRADAALRETSARLEATIAAAEVATWTWDMQADLISGDARMGAIFGLSVAELEGAPPARWFVSIHPDDVPPIVALLERAMRDGTPYDVTFRVRSPGGWRWVISRGQVEHGADGQPARLRGVVIDATRQIQAEQQLRASEERYHTLFDSLDEGVCVIEVLFDSAGAACDFRFLEVNPAFVVQTGVPSPVGKAMSELAPAHEQYWFDLFGHVVTTGEPVRVTYEAAALGRWYDVYATRIGPLDAPRVAVLFSDISERRRAEDELRRLAADLAEADRLKTEFLATLAHELRNPLAPIRNGLQLMRKAGNDLATVGRVQDIMDRQLDHLVHLVDDLLDVARITRGQVELKRDWVDLGQLVTGAVEISRPLVDAARHQLDVRLPPEPVRLFADPTRITQVISNLLNNAARYTPRGGRIVLTAARTDGAVRISVADNGVGIARAALPEVFKMFTQVGSGGHAHGGLGIGLSLVRTFVELHGGNVTVHSDGPGTGAVFTVRLPLHLAEAPPVPGPGGAPAASASAQSLRLLVVDDNRDAAETLAALLDVMGHATTIANEGTQALRLMHSFHPQAVFLDIGMPGMSGYEVAEAIRRDHAFDDVLLVALTGWGSELDRAKSASAGFDQHLTKPATINAIEAVLARVHAPVAG
ncbi:MAG: hybrid sensor histidine kinase/response regulator [Telluria sp.]